MKPARVAFSHPQPPEDGFLTVPLPCGCLDELVSVTGQARFAALVTSCPLCGRGWGIIVLGPEELEAMGVPQWDSPTGWTAAMREERLSP